MTEPKKPAAAPTESAAALKKATAKSAAAPKKTAAKAKPKSAAAHKPAVVKAVVGTALMVPNLTYRVGQRFLNWWRNR